jgi:WD40 repeat protein
MNAGFGGGRQLKVNWPRYPYPGLRPFRISPDCDEAMIFFGRTEHKDDVLERLNQSQFVSVVGPSGCGKSSLVKVGIIPALDAGLLTRAGFHWTTVQMRPGQDPLGNLARCLGEVCDLDSGFSVSGIEAMLRAERSGLWLLMDRLAPLLGAGSNASRPRRVLLVLDQFEEIFSGVQDQKAVDQFVGLITQFFRRPHPQLYVVLTMRTDFIGQCANFPGLAEILNKTQYITPVLRGQGLRDAISCPAETYGGALEDALIEQIMRDMGAGSTYDADHLPLMQHALLWLWQQAWPRIGATAPPNPGMEWPASRPKILLTLGDYQAHGGIIGILNHHADEIFGDVTARAPQLAGIAETMFRRLSERDASGRYKRAPAMVSEVCTLAGCARAALQPVIDRFAASDACFVELREGRPGDEQLDLSHESLIRQWKRLRGWANCEADMLARFLRIAGEAEIWQREGGSQSFLKSGGQFEVQDQWWRTHRPTPAWAARYSGGEAATGRISELLPLVEAFHASNKQLIRKNRLRRMAAAGAGVLLTAAIAIGFGLDTIAEEKDRAAKVQEAATQSHLKSAGIWGSRQIRTGHASTALKTLEAFLDNDKAYPHLPALESVAYAALVHAHEVRLLKFASQFNTTGFSPDGKWLLYMKDSSHLCFVKLTDADCYADSQTRLLRGVTSARWNRRGDRILAASADISALWLLPVTFRNNAPDIDMGRKHRLGDAENIARLGVGVFSPDGSRIVTGGDGQPLRVWDAQTGAKLAEQAMQRNKPFSTSFFIAMNADNTRIAEGLNDGGVSIYTVDEGAHGIETDTEFQMPKMPGRPSGYQTRSLEFHPKDPNLLLFGLAWQADVIDIKQKRLIFAVDTSGSGPGSQHPANAVVHGINPIVSQVAFDRAGSMIAVGAQDGAISLWNFKPDVAGEGAMVRKAPDVVPIMSGADGVPLYQIIFSLDGSQIASLGRDGAMRLWNVGADLKVSIGEARADRAFVPAGEDAIVSRLPRGLEVQGAAGRFRLFGLPAGFEPAQVFEDDSWIAVTPKAGGSQREETMLSHERDIALFRRGEASAPVAWLDPSPMSWSSATRPDWSALELGVRQVTGHTRDGRGYHWPVFSDRAELVGSMKAHAPAGDPDPAELAFELCLLGVQQETCQLDQ